MHGSTNFWSFEMICLYLIEQFCCGFLFKLTKILKWELGLITLQVIKPHKVYMMTQS